ncbi:hypothetical protein C0J52_04690 [Blattella germanica]|nr:hypothetical protein C0J52_04690 [Blattella germanica]
MSLNNPKMEISNLPDEMLILIFDYLKGVDRIRLSETCRRFSEILKEKRLSRKLDFSGSYCFSSTDLKFYLAPKVRREIIRELNVTSCYWLTSFDIFKVVRKLQNLHTLYAADTMLSIGSLIKIIECLPQLRRISCSWSMKNMLKSAMDQSFNNIAARLNCLEFMSFYIKTQLFTRDDFNGITDWLSHCTRLEELRIIGPVQCSSDLTLNTTGSVRIGSVNFPHLHTLVLSVDRIASDLEYLVNLYRVIFAAIKEVKNWRCLWITSQNINYPLSANSVSDASSLFIPRAEMRPLIDRLPNMEQLAIHSYLSDELLIYELPQLKRLYWCLDQRNRPVVQQDIGDIMSPELKMDWDALWNAFLNLEEVNIRTCMRDIDYIYSEQFLTKLALPICILEGYGDALQPSSKAAKSYQVMRTLVESCPNVEEFELTPCAICRFQASELSYESTLAIIGKWDRLRRLKLEGVHCIRTGKCLSHIMKTCKNLESISFKNLGTRAMCNYIFELRQGLRWCKNLKDFRFEQANVGSVRPLLQVLQSCTNLERICIIFSSHNTPPNDNDIQNLCEDLEKLIFLYIELQDWPMRCNILNTTLIKKYKCSRPAFFALLCGSRKEEGTKYGHPIPAKHYFEMLKDYSRVSIRLGASLFSP